MKIKKMLKTVTGVTLTSSFAVAMIPMVSCTTTVKNSAHDLTKASKRSNSTYVMLEFKSDDPLVTFAGQTKIKVRAGKKFASIISPTATKSGWDFKYWYYVTETGQTRQLDPEAIITEDLNIYPLFALPTYLSVTFNLVGDKKKIVYRTTSYFEPGTIFDDIEKPTVEHPSNPDLYKFVYWSYTMDSDNPQRVPYDYVPTNDALNVYSYFVLRNQTKEAYREIGFPNNTDNTLNFTATSDNASVTLLSEHDCNPYVYYKYDYQLNYYDNFVEETIPEMLVNFGQPIPIPKGHTLNLIGFDFDWVYTRPLVQQFSKNQYVYCHFVITGDVWLSGTVQGLISPGDGPGYQPLIEFGGESGRYCFYKLFYNATQNNPNSHLYISQDVRFNPISRSMYADLRFFDLTFLPFPIVYDAMYADMFAYSGISKIPVGLLKNSYGETEPHFERTIVNGYNIYQNMFEGCTNLKSIPDDDSFLKLNELSNFCFSGMFKGCTSLEYISPKLFSNMSLDNIRPFSFVEMFSGCEKIKISENDQSGAPILLDFSGIELKDELTTNMFKDCQCFGSDNFVSTGTPTALNRYSIIF